MTAIKFLLRVYSYLFHLALTLFLSGTGLLGWYAGTGSFSFGMIPWWTGQTLAKILALAGLAGLVAVLLAVRGKFKILFTLWTTTVLVAVVWGFFLSNYTFEGADGFKEALCFTAATTFAWIGGVQQLFRKR